jgi:hypothetical protein
MESERKKSPFSGWGSSDEEGLSMKKKICCAAVFLSESGRLCNFYFSGQALVQLILTSEIRFEISTGDSAF